jgi:hypothetical protein
LYPFKRPRYFGFVGSHKTTLGGFLYDGSGSGSASVTEIEIDDGGDDTVPIWSADPPGLQVQNVGGSHPFLFRDSRLLSRLAELLPPGSAAVSVAAVQGPLARAIDASVAGLVLRKSRRQPREVVVKLSIGPTAVAKGELVIEHRPLPSGGVKFDGAKWLRSPQSVRRVRVDLPPLGPQHYSVAIGALDDFAPGYYNVFFRRASEKKAAGQSAPFIVAGEAAARPPRRGARPAKKKVAKKKQR